jgi:hypothetical protein
LKIKNRLFFFTVFLIPIFFVTDKTLNCANLDGLESLKTLHINSEKQQVINDNDIIFEKNVEVLIDNKLHIWADKVYLNKKEKLLVAQKIDSGAIKIENNDFLILADKITLNLSKKTGSAENIKIHVREGYVSASKAEKLPGNRWQMLNMFYTPCDAQTPHWHIGAKKAVVHGGYFIKTSGLVFKIGTLPIFALPRMIFPIQGRSRSGFLIPKFSFDYESGLGIKEEYYFYINPNCDTTIGINWHHKKGVVFSDEFRWGRKEDNFTFINGHYAIAKNSFVQKEGTIFKATDKRYWIQGKDFRSYCNFFGQANFDTLIRTDFGTDKKIGYQFFGNIEGIEDSFFNSFLMRLLWPNDLLEIKLDNTRTSRKRFSDVCPEDVLFFERLKENQGEIKNIFFEMKELENQATTVKLPHVEWNSAYKTFFNTLLYRHDISVDRIFFREREIERFYFSSKLDYLKENIPLNKADIIRFDYRGTLQKYFGISGNMFNFYCNPNLQLRSIISKNEYHSKNAIKEDRIFANGAIRSFLNYGAEWAMPEGMVSSPSGFHRYIMQPMLKWDYVPKFYQKHWYHMDKWDRVFAKNRLTFEFRNNWILNNIRCDLNLAQSYDFYKGSDIFYLDRGCESKHLLPLKSSCSLNSEHLNLYCTQEYDLKEKRLLHFECSSGFKANRIGFNIGYLFQHPKIQQERALLSNIPHFVLVDFSFPLNKQASIYYDGQFYSEKGRHIFAFAGIQPILHRLRFEYNGHCWGFYIGFEEKKYREYGNHKRDRAIIFSLKLDSLGSFAKKFKNPAIMKV